MIGRFPGSGTVGPETEVGVDLTRSRSTDSACRSGTSRRRPRAQVAAQLGRRFDADALASRRRRPRPRGGGPRAIAGTPRPTSPPCASPTSRSVTGMIPGITGVVTPSASRSPRNSNHTCGVEEELREPEVGDARASRPGVAGRRARSVDAGWPSGCTATPTEKSPSSRTSSTRSVAWFELARRKIRGPSAGRRRAPGCSRRPRRGSASTMSTSSARRVRGAGEVRHRRSSTSRWLMRATRSWVRSRVDPPAP